MAVWCLSGLATGSLLFFPNTAQRVRKTIIAFVAGVLEQRLIGQLHREFTAPGHIPQTGITDGELVPDRLRPCTRDLLDDLALGPHWHAGAPGRNLIRK